VESTQPNGVELMPGIMEKVIQLFAETFEHIPIIASGLIQTKEEAANGLRAGATSLSVSNPALWNMTFPDLI
jgi:glycerol uptake operon antiterminator